MKHKKKKKGINPSAMRCQYCGGTVVLRSADGIYHENHSHTMLYVCSNYPRCDAYVRTHPGTNIPSAHWLTASCARFGIRRTTISTNYI